MAGGPIYLVPFNQTPASVRGLEVALQLAAAEKNARVHVVYVVVVNRRLPLDAEIPDLTGIGERCMSDAEHLARTYKVACEGDILQAREAGHAIVDEAVELGAQMIVLGVERNAPEGAALNLGKTAEYVLRHAPCAVLVVQREDRT